MATFTDAELNEYTNSSVVSSPNSMWTMLEQQTFNDIDKKRLLFDGNHEAYFVLPSGESRLFEYITINYLGDFLSETWKRFLFRRFPRLSTSTDLSSFIRSLDLPTISLPTELRKSYAGQAVLKCYYSVLSKRPVWRLWGAMNGEYTTFEYLESDSSQPYAVSFWYARKIKNEENKPQTIMIRERHSLVFFENGDVSHVQMDCTAHETSGGVPQNKLVNWALAWPDTVPPPQNEKLPIKRLPVVVINNYDRNGDGTGDSDYTRTCISLQKNLNKLAAIRQLVIDLSEFPQLMIPEEYLDADGQVDWNRVRLRIKYSGEDTDQTISTVSWTGNLENSDKQWHFYRQELLTVMGIAPILSGMAVADSEARTGAARRVGLIATESEVCARQHQWTKAFENIIKISIEMSNAFGNTNFPQDTQVDVIWAQVLPGEINEITSTLIAEVERDLRSEESAIELLSLNEDKSPEWFALEKERIAKQKAEKMVEEQMRMGDNNNDNPRTTE